MDFTSVILAAGQGARAGGYKPLWKLGKAAVIDRVIDTASSICKEVRVIGGYSFNYLKAHLESEYPNVTLLENPNWKEGMFSSVQTKATECDVIRHIVKTTTIARQCLRTLRKIMSFLQKKYFLSR